MKMIKPVVNFSKIIGDYDTIIVGFRGVLYDGAAIKEEAVSALLNCKKLGKKIILLTNSPMRVSDIVKFLDKKRVPLDIWDAIVTAGEIVHYKLKAQKGNFGVIGKKYYCIGSKKDKSIFNGLDYEEVTNITHADFIYMSEVAIANDIVEDYIPVLEYAASLSLPLLCVGNDTSSYLDGQICLAPGSIAEQYAVIGGRIITEGKPDPNVLLYSLDGIENVDKNRTLLIGDNLSTDIKGANLVGISGMLISKGIHVNFLGEGYIPDVTKARELAINFESYPDFVISNLRW